MQTNNQYSRAPISRKKEQYEKVGPATFPKTSVTNMNTSTSDADKLLNRSPMPLPQSSPMPGSTPPPLPPRQSSLQGIYSSPNNKRRCPIPVCEASAGYNYDVPKTRNESLPPSYDTLPSLPATIKDNHHKETKPAVSPKLMPKLTPVTASPSISMTLNTLITEHRNDFPLRVEVTAGYFGESERDTFSEGDVLNVHFAKSVTVAVVNCAGKEIKIPLNSAVKFSPLYDPNNNFKEANLGFTFKNIKEVIEAKPTMPALINARKSHKHGSDAYSVEKGDLLKILEVKHGKFGGQSLKCLTINGKKEKRLSESCQGDFTTDPDKLKLYLPEITTHIPMPIKAIPSVDEMVDDRTSVLIEAGVVTILRLEKEMTLVATLLLDEKTTATFGITKPMMFEIPADLKVLEVQVMKEENEDYESLYADTKEMMESFDPTIKSDNQVRVGHSDSSFYFDVGKDASGIELIASEAIYQDLPSILGEKYNRKARMSCEYNYTDRRSIISSVSTDSFNTVKKATNGSPLNESTNSLEKDGEDSVDDYCPMDPNTMSPFPPNIMSPFPPNIPIPLPPNTSDRLLHSPLQYAPMYGMQDVIQSMRTPELITDIPYDLKKEMEKVKKRTDELCQQVKELEQEKKAQQLLIGQLQDAVQKLQQSKTHTENYVQLIPSNKTTSIHDMTCDQVLEFLDENNMSKYKDAFKNEQINGSLLAELDQEILEKELGVVSGLHRKKILLKVQGKI